MKKSFLILCLSANLVFNLPVLADTTQVKIIARAPIEQIGADGSVMGVNMATPNTHYTLVKYTPVGINGRPQVVLADPQGQLYRIDLRATDYSPPPHSPSTNIATAPSRVISSSVATNAPPQPATPAILSNLKVDDEMDNVVDCPGAYSYHAPRGWKIDSGRDYTTARDMRGGDCVAMISVFVAQETYIFNGSGVSLDKFVQDSLNMDKKVHSMPSAQQTAQIGDLQPYTTQSGWEGLKCVMTITAKGNSSQILYYYFAGHGDTKIIVEVSCHGDQVDHDTPLFEYALKSLVQK